MKTIEIKNIDGEILFSHSRESNTTKATLEKAASIRADLRYADLSYANLSGANLSGADLRDADLREADLSGANLSGANLRGAYLSGADLRYADLSYADLSYANLRGANLRGAYLRCADLRGADLRGAKNIPFIPLACPSEGAFIGWKKVGNCLIQLEIPADAKRCSATTNKCRCDKALVVSIIDITNNKDIEGVINNSYAKCEYRVGRMVYPDGFNDNRWDECSNGIHFFINKQEAINY